MESGELSLPDLDNLTVKQLRELITLVSRQTTLKNYQHICSAQRKCTTCGVALCYACYNMHLHKVHGLEAAIFNDKLNSGSLMLPERQQVKIKTSSKTRKIKKEKFIKTPWGKYTKAQLAQFLDSLG